jgi:hypothetical protein
MIMVIVNIIAVCAVTFLLYEFVWKNIQKKKTIMEGSTSMEKKLTLINTNLRRYTFQSPKIKTWVESRSKGKVLNLFAGLVKLDLDEVRNDIDETMNAEFHKEALDFVRNWDGPKFDTIILDPPYSYRKAMEMYNGHRNSKFKLVADNLSRILNDDGSVISFGYHSSFMGKIRGYTLKELCVFAHGGAQHCTIGIVEVKK